MSSESIYLQISPLVAPSGVEVAYRDVGGGETETHSALGRLMTPSNCRP